jgi:hypothetical protein
MPAEAEPTVLQPAPAVPVAAMYIVLPVTVVDSARDLMSCPSTVPQNVELMMSAVAASPI